MMWNDISNNNTITKIEQLTETTTNKNNKETGSTNCAATGLVPSRTTTPRSIAERHDDSIGYRIEHQDVAYMSQPASPAASTKRKHVYPRLIASEIPFKDKETKDSQPSINPLTQKVWELLSTRSYPLTKIPSTGPTSTYHTTPSPLQKASFGNAVLNAVRQNNATKLQGRSLVALFCRTAFRTPDRPPPTTPP